MSHREHDEARMTLGEHLEELRRSLIRALVGLGVGIAVCVIFGDRIMQIMCWPGAVALRRAGLPMQLRTLAPMDAFSTYLRMCLIWGAILAAPYSLWQLWRFVAVGLYPNERRHVYRAVPFSVGLFFIGVLFFFIVVAPVMLGFLLNFGQENFPRPPWASHLAPGGNQPAATQPGETNPLALPVLEKDPPNPSDGQVWVSRQDGQIRIVAGGKVRRLEPAPETFLSPELTLNFYMTFVSYMSLIFGLCFQVPVVVLVLTRTGIMPPERLKGMRKYVLIAIIVVAAIITPTGDPLNLAILAGPMYLLYELGLLMSRASARKQAADQPKQKKESPWL